MPSSPSSLLPQEYVSWMVNDTEGKPAPNRTYFVPTENWSAQDWADVNTTIDGLNGHGTELAVTYETHGEFWGVHIFAVSSLEHTLKRHSANLELIPTLNADNEEIDPVAA